MQVYKLNFATYIHGKDDYYWFNALTHPAMYVYIYLSASSILVFSERKFKDSLCNITKKEQKQTKNNKQRKPFFFSQIKAYWCFLWRLVSFYKNAFICLLIFLTYSVVISCLFMNQLFIFISNLFVNVWILTFRILKLTIVFLNAHFFQMASFNWAGEIV